MQLSFLEPEPEPAPQPYQARGRSPQVEFYRDCREKALRLLGSKCCHCGNDDSRVLDFDHIHNDGHTEPRGGYNRVLRVLQEPHRFQILCRNCNWLKFLDARHR